MSVTALLETQQERVELLESKLDQVAEVVDTSRAVLAQADDALARAEVAVIEARRRAPAVIGVVVAVTAVAVVAFVVMRRRRAAEQD